MPDDRAASSGEALARGESVGRSSDRGGAAEAASSHAPTPPATPPAMPSSAPSTTAPTPAATLPPGLTSADVAAGLLAADVPRSASGKLVVVPGSDPAPGAGKVRTVRVEYERGLAVDGLTFARFVMAALNDPRGWGADGRMTFARTDGKADLRVVLASPSLVDTLCAPLRTRGEVSCGRSGRATINLKRWTLAIPEYQSDPTAYRNYVVNHEVGHLLGHQHQKCPGKGQLAPVMQQQSYGVAPCVPNPWPYP